jgi:DNA-binding MarR family transcriptional regulator
MIKKTLNASVIYHVINFSETIKKQAEKTILSAGITTQQWFILLLLAKDPNIIYLLDKKHEKDMMAKELAEALNVSRANITNLVGVLIAKNLLLQYEDEEDKRRKRLRLTEQGEKLLLSFEGLRTTYNKKLFDGVSKEEKEAFVTFIQKTLKVMKTEKK